MFLPSVPPHVAVVSTRALATADFTIANRVSEDVAAVVEWSFAHGQYWLAKSAILLLQGLDDAGSFLISAVVWLVLHT